MRKMKVKIINMNDAFKTIVPNVEFISTLKKMNMIERFIQKAFKVSMAKERDGWLSDIIDAKAVIVFDSTKNYATICKKIEENSGASAKLIFFAWNPILYSNDWLKLSARWIKTTFSLSDMEIYGLVYVGTFFNDKKYTLNLQDNPIYDGYFIGIPKDRLRTLKQIILLFQNNGLKVKTRIVDNLKALYNPNYSHRISYEDVINETQKSKVIIEILQEGQTGPSLRCMESIFLKKKLITTNKSIVDYDFYNPHNIFIYGKDDARQFIDFVNSPYMEISQQIIDGYKFEKWLERITEL